MRRSFLIVCVSVFALANELFAASGADKILGIDLAVEHDGFTALGVGASDLEAVVIAIAIAVTITIAIVAIAVAVVAIAIVTAAIVELFLERTEILVDLLDVIIQILEILVGIVLSCRNVGNDVNKSVDKLTFCALFVELKSFRKAFYIGCLFDKCHSNLHSAAQAA